MKIRTKSEWIPLRVALALVAPNADGTFAVELARFHQRGLLAKALRNGSDILGMSAAAFKQRERDAWGNLRAVALTGEALLRGQSGPDPVIRVKLIDEGEDGDDDEDGDGADGEVDAPLSAKQWLAESAQEAREEEEKQRQLKAVRPLSGKEIIEYELDHDKDALQLRPRDLFSNALWHKNVEVNFPSDFKFPEHMKISQDTPPLKSSSKNLADSMVEKYWRDDFGNRVGPAKFKAYARSTANPEDQKVIGNLPVSTLKRALDRRRANKGAM